MILALFMAYTRDGRESTTTTEFTKQELLLDVETNPEARIERVDVLQGLWDCLPIQVQLACQHRAEASLSLEY